MFNTYQEASHKYQKLAEVPGVTRGILKSYR